MSTLNKFSMSLTKTFKQLKKDWPIIKWSLTVPEPDVILNYGVGLVLTGSVNTINGINSKSFFILEKDRDQYRWGMLIVAFLIGDVVEEPDDEYNSK